MTTVGEHIQGTSAAICQNIAALTAQRDLLSQNILAQLRNLVEGAAVRIHLGTSDAEYKYDLIGSGLDFVRSKGQYSFLTKFHKLLQISASHYTVDGDASERLMLKYYEYLLRIRNFLKDSCGIDVLENLELFPVDLDPSLREYHEKIAARIVARRGTGGAPRNRYYIHKTRPFFVDGNVYYEVTFYRAVNRFSKFDRIIAFTDIDMTDKYSAMLTLQPDSISILDRTMPITLIRDWEVSIRPCEFDNFTRLVGFSTSVRTSSDEYRFLMHALTASSGSLLDLIDMSDVEFEAAKVAGTMGVARPQIFPALEKARRIIRAAKPGHNVLRYLLLKMYNATLKPQYDSRECYLLSDLNLKFGCNPFDKMPFCTSLIEHNPRYWDLAESLDITGRSHELLARRVKNNVETHGILYTPVADLQEFGNVNDLVAAHNGNLYHTHKARELVIDMGHVFIRGYEDNTVTIVEKLQEYAASGVKGYEAAVDQWLDEAPRGFDDKVKVDALRILFGQSRVAVVHGAAGTGKSTMVDHIAQYFNDKTKLFLAHTHPAIDNLKRRVTAQNADFRTISGQIARGGVEHYDLLVIDECSTVSNDHLIKVIESTSFTLLVLVGDVYQIESIRFGNWFGIAQSFIPQASVFELTTPYRTKNDALLSFWNKVRRIDDDLVEVIAREGYSTVLDHSLFEPQREDEIILCLNYDGLYGINNVNRFLQSGNPNTPVTWRTSTYRIGDPILFNETERFWPTIYNNLKGWIVGIEVAPGEIQFDVKLDRPLTELDVGGGELEWVEDSVVRFSVYDYDASDDDDDSINTSVPFQVAYAVSIHKAQGIEYDSVKIVITDANEDDITHSIFYTAVTRARESLKIFWTPETQQAVLSKLQRPSNQKDVALLMRRRGLTSA